MFSRSLDKEGSITTTTFGRGGWGVEGKTLVMSLIPNTCSFLPPPFSFSGVCHFPLPWNVVGRPRQRTEREEGASGRIRKRWLLLLSILFRVALFLSFLSLSPVLCPVVTEFFSVMKNQPKTIGTRVFPGTTRVFFLFRNIPPVSSSRHSSSSSSSCLIFQIGLDTRMIFSFQKSCSKDL